MSETSYNATDKIGVGFYHLEPRWCSHADFRYTVNLGLTNSYKLECSAAGTTLDALAVAREHGHQAWLGVEKYNVFGKSLITVPEFVSKIRRTVERIKEQDLWDTVVGFHWDEPIMGMSNDDFLAVTKALSEEFGKRIFPVFCAYEATGRQGNFDDPAGTIQLQSYATKYITDFGFDCYGYDFRLPHNEKLLRQLAHAGNKVGTEFHTTEDFFRFYLKTLQGMMENKNARVWVFPTAYSVATWGGYRSDEDYCIAHARGLKKLLLEFENPGGIYYYTYKTWTLREPAMDIHLAKDNPERWNRYEACAREILQELRDIKIKP